MEAVAPRSAASLGEPRSWRDDYLEAHALCVAGQAPSALPLLLAASRAAPREAEPAVLLAYALAALNAPLALALTTRVLAVHPSHEDALALRCALAPHDEAHWAALCAHAPARGYAQLAWHVPAGPARVRCAQAALNAAPHDERALLAHALAADTLESAASLVARRPALAPARVLLARLLLREDAVDAALMHARAALRWDSRSRDAWTLLGQLLSRHGDAAGAARAFGEALQRREPPLPWPGAAMAAAQ